MPGACRLYLVTPPQIADLERFVRDLEASLGSGDVAALQIRLKPATDQEIADAVARLAPLVHAAGASLILNDRPDLAAALGCDGVHVGQGDPSVSAARRLVGEAGVVGATCHDSRHLAMEAAEQGADYVAFGAFFPTATKATTARPDPEILTVWQETMLTPCVAIGGISVANGRSLVAAGADFLAVSSGVWDYPDGPAAAVAAFELEIAAGLAERRDRRAALPAGRASTTSGR